MKCTYIAFAILCHLNRYETQPNSKYFIFSTTKAHFLPFSTDMLNYNHGLFFIFFGIVFLFACLFCCFNLASAVFTHSSFFFVLASLTAISLCFCFTIANILSLVMRYSWNTFFFPGPLWCTGNGAKSPKVQTLLPIYNKTLFKYLQT